MYAIETEATPAAASPLTLAGPCGYAIQNGRIVITIGEIANHRNLDDLSGTLAIELWALERPYSGGGFTGTPLCGTRIGELLGRHVLTDCRYDLIFQAPPPGTWYLALMLREWTATGYHSRDYVNFALPYVVERKPSITMSETGKATNVQFAGNQNLPATPVEPTATPPAPDGSPGEAAVPRARKPPPDPAVSLNTARGKEIAAAKGISKKGTENIVTVQPFASLDEPLKVKGVGAKLIKKVRQFIRL